MDPAKSHQPCFLIRIQHTHCVRHHDIFTVLTLFTPDTHTFLDCAVHFAGKLRRQILFWRRSAIIFTYFSTSLRLKHSWTVGGFLERLSLLQSIATAWLSRSKWTRQKDQRRSRISRTVATSNTRLAVTSSDVRLITSTNVCSLGCGQWSVRLGCLVLSENQAHLLS